MATKVLDELTVASLPPAPGGVLPLTFFDVPWLFTGPVEGVFFYPYPLDDFEELSGGSARDVARLYALVPQLLRTEDGSFALAAVQVTVVTGKGLAVGVSIHHVACDDSSFMHFVKTWAGQCRVAADEATAVAWFDRGTSAEKERGLVRSAAAWFQIDGGHQAASIRKGCGGFVLSGRRS
jgi:hypothetical protein